MRLPAFHVAEKVVYFVILSEAKNLSCFCAREKKERFFTSLRMTKWNTFSAAWLGRKNLPADRIISLRLLFLARGFSTGDDFFNFFGRARQARGEQFVTGGSDEHVILDAHS